MLKYRQRFEFDNNLLVALTVSIDTGSADLWVLPPNGPSSLKLTKTTEVAVTQSYDIGDVKGTAQFAELEFAGFTIPSQGNAPSS